MLCASPEPCEHRSMIHAAYVTLALVAGQTAPAEVHSLPSPYDFRARTREIAFDPVRFFPSPARPVISVRYMGYAGYPVYAVAVHGGCLVTDKKAGCSGLLRARMVRSPYAGKPPRTRNRGHRLYARIAQAKPMNDKALRSLFDKGELEWLEADVQNCPTAMAHLATGRDLRFSNRLKDIRNLQEPGFHSDYMIVEVGSGSEMSRYEGWPKPGTPGEWANEFTTSLETCWKPAAALAPWHSTQE